MPITIPTDSLTSRAKVKSFLGITDSTSDALIDELITYVTQFIKNYCGRQFLVADYVEIKDTYRGRRVLFLKQYPVNTVASVEYRAGTPTSPVWNTYDANSYLPYFEEGYIKFYAKLPETMQGMRVNYNAGYLIDFTNEFDVAHHTLPEDITLVATEMCATILNTRKSAGISTETTEGQSITYGAKDLSINAKTVLANYQRNNAAR